MILVYCFRRNLHLERDVSGFSQTEFGSKIHHHKTSLWHRTTTVGQISNMVKAAGELLSCGQICLTVWGPNWFLRSGEEGCSRDKLSKDATVLAQLFPLSSKAKAPITSSEKIRLTKDFWKSLTTYPMISIKRERIPLMNHLDPSGSLWIISQTAASGFPMQNYYLQQSLRVFLSLHKFSFAIPLLQLASWQACKNRTQSPQNLTDPH